MSTSSTRPRFPLLLKSTNGPLFLPLESILRIDAEDKYARLHLTDRPSVVLMHSLADIEERLACGERIGRLVFLRTHRSCIVAMHHVEAVQEREGLWIAGKLAPVSRNAWTRLHEVLGTVRSTEHGVRSV